MIFQGVTVWQRSSQKLQQKPQRVTPLRWCLWECVRNSVKLRQYRDIFGQSERWSSASPHKGAQGLQFRHEGSDSRRGFEAWEKRRLLYHFFLLLVMLLASNLRIHCQTRGQEDLPLCFLLIFRWFSYRLLIRFELIFDCGMRLGSSFILLRVDTQLFQHHLLTVCSFLVEWSWHPCWKAIGHACVSLFLDFRVSSVSLYVYPYGSSTQFWLL